jgi:Winged helix-turn helix
MSKKEFGRIEVLLGVQSGRLRVADACELLNLKRRQVFRLLAGLKHGGAASLVSKRRGRERVSLVSATRTLRPECRRAEQARLRPARHLVALIWLARNRQETDLASADIALALAADAADGGAINPEDASDIGIAAEAISMPFARPTSAKVHSMGAPLFRTLQPARRRRRRSIGGNIDTSVRNGFRRGCQRSRSSTSSPLTRTNLPRFGNGGAP